MSNYDELANVKMQINNDLGYVDILVNNAGLMPKVSLREGHQNDIKRVMDINVLAHFWVKCCFYLKSIQFHSITES